MSDDLIISFLNDIQIKYPLLNREWTAIENAKEIIQKPSAEKADTVSLKVYEQVMRERDIAIQQLKELGYEFGEKIEQESEDTGIKLDEAIERYTSNAEFERTHGNLRGCLEFRQLAKWLRELKTYRYYLLKYKFFKADPESENK